MINSTAIRTAIAELLEGTIGNTRSMRTSEYLTDAANDFTTWTPVGTAAVSANTAYGPSGHLTADLLTTTGSNAGLSSSISTVPDNTTVRGSVYAWTASGTATLRLNLYLKDGSVVVGDLCTVTTTRTRFATSSIDVLSGVSVPSLFICLPSASAVYLSDAHVTSDTNLFGKRNDWADSVLSSTIEPIDGDLILNSRYDTHFVRTSHHDATPVSSAGSHKIESIDVEIQLVHELASNVQKALRDTARERVLYDGDRIKQALAFPNNLASTSSGVATGIISGMILDINHTIRTEDWDSNPARIESTISGKFLVHVTQPTDYEALEELTIMAGYSTTEPIHLYVSNIYGSDDNAGTSIDSPLKTIVAAEDLIPYIIQPGHEVIVDVYPYDSSTPNVGAYVWPTFRKRIENAPIIVRGVGYNTTYSGVAGAGTDQIHVVASGLTSDAYVVQGASISITSGLAIGDKRNISENTETAIHVSNAFSVAVSPGDTYDVILPLIRVSLVPETGDEVLLAEGCSTRGCFGGFDQTGLYLVNLQLETALVDSGCINIQNEPVSFYGVNVENAYVLRSNASVCAGTERETDVAPYQKNHTLTEHCPDISPTLTSLTGWGLVFTSGYACLATEGDGYNGYIISYLYLIVRGSDSSTAAGFASQAVLCGGRAGITIVGDLQTFGAGSLRVVAAKSAADPHLDFKFRDSSTSALITNSNGVVSLAHCDLGTTSLGDLIRTDGVKASTYLYRSSGHCAGIALRCAHGGTLQCEGAPAFTGVTGDFSEDNGLTLRAIAALTNNSYYHDLRVDSGTHVVTGHGSLIFRQD